MKTSTKTLQSPTVILLYRNVTEGNNGGCLLPVEVQGLAAWGQSSLRFLT